MERMDEGMGEEQEDVVQLHPFQRIYSIWRIFPELYQDALVDLQWSSQQNLTTNRKDWHRYASVNTCRSQIRSNSIIFVFWYVLFQIEVLHKNFKAEFEHHNFWNMPSHLFSSQGRQSEYYSLLYHVYSITYYYKNSALPIRYSLTGQQYL